MKTLTMGPVACLAFIVMACVAQVRADGPVADETRMVPGDAVIGNLVQYGPGHAGIYIGRWRNLPAALQEKYAKVFDEALIRSRDHGLKHSYLVVDSMPGKGVRLRAFAEQFTAFMPSLAQPTLVNTLEWESKKGAAIGWPDLPPGDPRRWAVVEEALKAARARVAYEVTHFQTETTFWRSKDDTPYDQIGALDCIAFVHVMYWRGAAIDLDVSWMPLHTPEALYSDAVTKKITRGADLKAVFRDTAVTGLWTVTIKTLNREPEEGFNGEFPMWVELRDGTIHLAAIEEGAPLPATDLYPLTEPVIMGPDDTLSLSQMLDTSTLRLKIASDGALSGTFDGVDDDGPFKMTLTGHKRRDYQNVR